MLSQLESFKKLQREEQKKWEDYETVFASWFSYIENAIKKGEKSCNLKAFDNRCVPTEKQCQKILEERFQRHITFERNTKFKEYSPNCYEICWYCIVNIGLPLKT